MADHDADVLVLDGGHNGLMADADVARAGLWRGRHGRRGRDHS